MIRYPTIHGRKTLTVDANEMRDALMLMIPRLDLMGEGAAADHIIQAVEALVGAPPGYELSADEADESDRQHEE